MINPKYSTLQKYVERLNPSQRYLIGEFIDNYEDGVMDRRDLLERVYRITGSVAAAAGTLLAGHYWGVWAGARLVVWGTAGYGHAGEVVGGRYDPRADSWAPVAKPPRPARGQPVWTGREVLIWDGGDTAAATVGSGARGVLQRYDPVADRTTRRPIGGRRSPIRAIPLPSTGRRGGRATRRCGRARNCWSTAGTRVSGWGTWATGSSTDRRRCRDGLAGLILGISSACAQPLWPAEKRGSRQADPCSPPLAASAVRSGYCASGRSSCLARRISSSKRARCSW